MFYFVFADENGNSYHDEQYGMLGLLGDAYVEPSTAEMIPLPAGASLTMIPNRRPVVLDGAGRFITYPGAGWVVGALLPQGYTRTLLPAFMPDPAAAPLPLFGYAALGMKDGAYYVAAMQTDVDEQWNPRHFNSDDLPERVASLMARFPQNPLLPHLGHCALTYGCFTAQNIFYHRWEGGIPVSSACNARCIGCISLQESECCPAPQSRINFAPTSEEIAELTSWHLQSDADAIVSFGQGCEGDPSLAADRIAIAISQVRSHTKTGTINMNTNAGYTAGIKTLCAAGIDSFRVSLNSAAPAVYDAYYRPTNYSLADVRASLQIAQNAGIYTYLNLLLYPGLNDREGEVEALLDLVKDCGVRAIQLRNLNIDPQMLTAILDKSQGDALGVPTLVEILRGELPHVAIGNYTKPIIK